MGGSDVTFTVNGESRRMRRGATLSELVEELGFGERRIALERNLDVVSKADRDSTRIEDGDVIEIVSFVGGG